MLDELDVASHRGVLPDAPTGLPGIVLGARDEVEGPGRAPLTSPSVASIMEPYSTGLRTMAAPAGSGVKCYWWLTDRLGRGRGAPAFDAP
jgi:hypothetical protein